MSVDRLHLLSWVVVQASVAQSLLCQCHVAQSLLGQCHIPGLVLLVAGGADVVAYLPADRLVPVSCAEYLYCVLHADVHANVATHASLGSSCTGCTGSFPSAQVLCFQLCSLNVTACSSFGYAVSDLANRSPQSVCVCV